MANHFYIFLFSQDRPDFQNMVVNLRSPELSTSYLLIKAFCFVLLNNPSALLTPSTLATVPLFVQAQLFCDKLSAC